MLRLAWDSTARVKYGGVHCFNILPGSSGGKMMRGMSTGTYCAMLIAGFLLMSVASNIDLKDACSLQMTVDHSSTVHAMDIDSPEIILPSWTAESNQEGAFFGGSVASAGDVNGDGYDDVVVGASGYSHDQKGEGCAYLYLGSASGLAAMYSWVVEGNETATQFGRSVAPAGDVNRDGYGDVLIGTGNGHAYLYAGSASGLSAEPSWVAENDQRYSYFGWSVASAGDVNNDTYDDVVIGAYAYDSDEEYEGRAYLYMGSISGLSEMPSWIAESNQPYTAFGSSVASAGDVNNDGYDEVIIGAYSAGNSTEDEDYAYLYMGSASGLSAEPSWIAESDLAGSVFGWSVASAGDVNNDGCDDVLVGAPYSALGEMSGGYAYLYMGSTSGLSETPSWTVEGNQADAYFGRPVASAGDLNDDGYDDVVVGEYDFLDDGTGRGRAYIYMGSGSGLSTTPSWIAECDQADAAYGISLASAGDVNNDGSDDVVVGAPLYPNGGTYTGRTFLYLGGDYLAGNEESFVESYGLALGIVIALVVVAMVMFFVLKGRKGGMAPTSMEEAPASEPEVHSEGHRS